MLGLYKAVPGRFNAQKSHRPGDFNDAERL